MLDTSLLHQFLSLRTRVKIKGVVAILGILIGISFIAVGAWLLTRASTAELALASPDLDESKIGTIIVDIRGAVDQPGVYKVKYGDRVAQAVAEAGGLSPAADARHVTQNLNLAERVSDGQKIYIPFASESAKISTAPSINSESSNGISLNSAPQSVLESLPSIGEKRAASIIENRPYTNIDELISKEIVTEKIFAEIKSMVTL
ncbi:MAG: helix-hairpin-helix domain-containing protein [bacterium]|nr:helix-hairpin-helix domain-containing protein [bacterium]